MQPVFSYFWTEYRKIWTRNNSIFRHFSRSVGNKIKKNPKLVVKRTQSRSKFQENKLLKYFVKYYVLNLTLFPATFSQY